MSLSPWRSLLALAVSALLGLSLLACDKGKDGPRTLAELVEVVSGSASRLGSNKTWSSAAQGSTFVEGDSLRTDEEGVARLRFAGEVLRMGPSTTVFFGRKKIDFDGEIEVGKGVANMGIDFGDAEITTTGTLRLVKRGKALRFEVLVGRATVSEGGVVSTLEAGQELVFEIGTGIVEEITADVPDAAPASSNPRPAADGGVPVPPGSAVHASVEGNQVHTRANDGEAWRHLEAGEHDFSDRTELRIKGRSSVVVTRGEDRVTLTRKSLAVIDGRAREMVELMKGRANARSESGHVVIAVPGGSIQLHTAGDVAGNAQIDVDRRGALTKVKTGRATVHTGDAVEEIGMGETVLLDRGSIKVVDPAPTTSHLTLATPTATLHVVATPANLRVDFREHCERGVVEVARGSRYKRPRQRRAGEGSAILSLGRGRHRYRVRCYVGDELASEPAVEGKVTVERDSGNRPLSRVAPTNRIDADGRSYTVLYQNRLPALRFRWPKAPPASGYVLHVAARRGRTKTIEARKAEARSRSGAFGEGEYEYWFTGGGKESKRSHLTISFDNAAARGYVSSPSARKRITGSEVRVAGAAVAGWSVFVGDRRLALDKQFRFDEMVPVSKDGVAIRFTHPKYGNHYYVRGK